MHAATYPAPSNGLYCPPRSFELVPVIPGSDDVSEKAVGLCGVISQQQSFMDMSSIRA